MALLTFVSYDPPSPFFFFYRRLPILYAQQNFVHLPHKSTPTVAKIRPPSKKKIVFFGIKIETNATPNLVTTIQIYDIRLKSYRTALEEFQPSWDGIVQTRRTSRGSATAMEYVARDLDDLNGRYEELVDALQRRLQLLCDMAQQELDEFEVMNPLFFLYLFTLFFFLT